MLLAVAAIASVVASSTAVPAAELPLVKACGHHD
jgi:hypothetical protein